MNDRDENSLSVRYFAVLCTAAESACNDSTRGEDTGFGIPFMKNGV